MSDITIEKNVPMPDDGKKATLDLLEIGDSFPINLADRRRWASLISSEFHALTDKRFKVSSKGQPKKKGRVWRLEDAPKENLVEDEA
jgi:hypothetical protein